MTNETKVDVLAVIDAAASDNDCICGHHACSKQRFRKELLKARAAVAELIEAGPAMLRFLDQHQYLDRNGDVRRFRAALARVGGA